MQRENWIQIAKKADFYGLAKQFGLDPVTIRLMVNRGADTAEKIQHYLYDTWEQEYDPALMKGAQEAAERLRSAIERGESILIASDFDADGIFSGQILLEAIREAGGNPRVQAPDRRKEGYGVNTRMVEQAAADGVGTIITCDNGIAALDAIRLAKEKGMQVIVTDHHECQYRETAEGREPLLPEADVIVNPHQPGCNYPFKGLCGAGVAYKVVQLLYRLCGIPRERSLHFLEYVGIATVADVMDLKDENRIFVREGLKRLPHTNNEGLSALLECTGLSGRRLSAYHIGFVIGPCFNSSGRLDTVDAAFRLLAGGPEAVSRAEYLKELNEARKSLSRQGEKQAMEWIAAREKLPDILLIPLADCPESVVGIVAGHIREKVHRPVIVLAKSDSGWKASGRSIEAWNMFEGLSACRDLMTKFGGHPMAAGFSLPEENIEPLARRLNENSGLTEEDFVPIIKIDVPMPLQYITEERIEELSVLEPFGKGNPKPLFGEARFKLLRAAVLGKNRNVVRMQVQNAAGKVMEAIRFGDAEEFDEIVREAFGEDARAALFRGWPNPVQFALAYYPEVNEYMGQRSLQIVVEHMRPVKEA